MTTDAIGVRDLWLASGSALLATVALALALGSWRITDEAPTTPTVASVKQSTGEVKIRLALTLGWHAVRRGESVHDGDALFVPPGADTTLSFVDGTELAIDERSLVVVERPRAGTRLVTLRQGAVSSRVGVEGLTLQTPVGEARLASMTEARVELQGEKLEVFVKQGTAKVKSENGSQKAVLAGQRVLASAQGAAELPDFGVKLLSPDSQARFPFRGKPAAVTLQWEGEPDGARVQVARDRLFAFVDFERPAAGASLVLAAPSKGVTWWRLVDIDGHPLSEARRFTCIEDVAPIGMSPRNGEVMLVPLGTSASFAWTPLPGISRYQFEISSTQTFETLAVTEVTNGASTRVTLSLNEADWYWRVRAADEASLGMPSVPLRFRIIHKGIPDAPELLNPEIEVTP